VAIVVDDTLNLTDLYLQHEVLVEQEQQQDELVQLVEYDVDEQDHEHEVQLQVNDEMVEIGLLFAAIIF